jgi:hypothetical protein
MTAFDGWDNFYVIVGSSAGALIGLQFVVLTLIADSPPAHDEVRAGGAFSTPSVVHFGAVLLLSAIVTAPWHGLEMPAALWGPMGVCGLVYMIIVARRMRAQTAYRPVLEDWIFHAVLPLAGYATLIVSACMARASERPAQFVVGAASLLLLFVGIHNAWDATMYQVFVRRREQQEREKRP